MADRDVHRGSHGPSPRSSRRSIVLGSTQDQCHDGVPLRIPSEPILNMHLTTELGQPVVKFEVLPIREGETLQIVFRSSSSAWRQGIWLGVHGELEVAGARGDQFEIWADTSPPSLEIRVLRSEDGFLRLYNTWDMGPGHHHESQSATSGMLKKVSRDGTVVYRCNDIDIEPKFDKLVFELSRAF